MPHVYHILQCVVLCTVFSCALCVCKLHNPLPCKLFRQIRKGQTSSF